MKKLIIAGIILTLPATLLLPLAGCTGETEETEPVTSENNRWLGYLRIFPENETTLAGTFIQTSDYREMLKRYYTEKSEEPVRSVERVAFNNLELFNYGSYSDEEWKNTLGFTIDDVTATIIASAGPPNEYQAVYGTFTAEDIETAAKTGPLQEYLEIKTHSGYEYYSWGEDMGIHMSPEWQSNIRNFGRGHRLAYVNGFALWMIWTEGIEDMIDAYAGNIPSLADKEDYRLLAAELEKTGVATAFFSSDVLSLAEFIERTREHLTDVEGSVFEEQDPLGDEPLLKPFTSFVTGAGEDEDGRFMVIILFNPEESIAKVNVTLLEARIKEADMYPHIPDWRNKTWVDEGAIESMEITSKGRLTIAKLYSEVIFSWKYFHYYSTQGPYSPLLLHE